MKKNKILSKKYKALPELKEFEELVGHFIQYWGFKKIHGRIWAHLYTSKVPLDSQSLMMRLKVSKALMSLAVRDLLEFDVIAAASVGKHGVTYYEANPDLLSVITNVLKKREAPMMAAVDSCLQRMISKSETKLQQTNLDVKKLQGVKILTESAIGLLGLFITQSCATSQTDNLNIFSELKFEK